MTEVGDPFMRKPDAALQARTKAQTRATVLQLKLIGQSHPTGLTNNLLKLFEPRPPLEYKPPLEKKSTTQYTGLAQFVDQFAEKDDPEYQPPKKRVETPAERRAKIHRLRLEKGAEKAAEELEKYDPNKDPNIVGDPYKTLFVARLNYETTERKIKREFEVYGPIKRARLVHEKDKNKPRGYAFVEFMHTRDMKTAYKQADGRKIDNRRVLVDVERGRTVPNWRPRRLGGGLGSTRIGGEEVNQKHSGREPQLLSAGLSRLEEPRIRDDRYDDWRERDRIRERSHDHERSRDREKSRERERSRDKEKSRDRERSRDRVRGRDRELNHDYDKGLDTRSHDRHHRDRDREREKERERDREHGHGRDRDRERSGREREKVERLHSLDYDLER